MSVLAVLTPIVVLANGLAAGVLVGTQLGGWPLLAELPPDRYVHAHAFFATRYDPFMPVCLIVTAVGDVLLALLAPGVARMLAVLAVALVVSTVLISATKNVPINRWIRTLDPDNLPPDFDRKDPRRHWGAWNRSRSALTILALLANCGALAALIGGH